MRYRIKISRNDYDSLKELVLRDHPQEGAAFALAGIAKGGDPEDILVRRIIQIPQDFFLLQGEDHLRISSQAINGIIALCEKNKLGVIICHSHPADIPYSVSDDRGEGRIVEVLRKFIPQNAPTASLLFYPDGVRGRVWVFGSPRPVMVSEIRIIGETLKSVTFEKIKKQIQFDLNLFDRQILAFGKLGQALISSTKVGVVGVGGTGSPTAEQLVRLGVQDIVLVDKDIFDPSNLTRVYGTFACDVAKGVRKLLAGPDKVLLVAHHLKHINPKVNVIALKEDVVTKKGVSALLDRDIIFLCTDNHWSRAVVNRLAYQYFIPVINMGVRVDAKDGGILGASGVIDILRPDLPCLWCSGAVRSDRVATESTPQQERRERVREGYVQDVGTNAPSVVSLTTAVSGLAVTCFLQLLTGFMKENGAIQRLNYHICSGEVRRGATQKLDKCICKSVRGFGDLKKLDVLS